jgi:hypothetical protein
MAENSSGSPEDLGAPRAYLVLSPGTRVWDRSGDLVGSVEHVLADDKQDIFHGLILKTPDGDRFASSDQVDGIFERGVIVAKPARDLVEPSDSAAAGSPLRRAWDWLIHPRR